MLEICHTTHNIMLYVILHSKSIVEENAKLSVSKLNVRYINGKHINIASVLSVFSLSFHDHPVLYSDNTCLQTS